MPAITQTIRDTLIKNVTAATIGTFSFLIASLYFDDLAGLSDLQLETATLLKVLALLVLWGSWATFLAIIYFRKTYVRPPAGGYDFIEDPGYYRHRKTGGHYCNPCLAKGYASRLSVHHEDGYKCRNCGEVYVPPGSGTAAFESYSEQGT